MTLPERPIIGVVHLPALPGAAGAALSLAEIMDRAVEEAGLLQRCGFGGLIVENFGDAPFRGSQVEAHTVAAMTRCVAAVRGGVAIPIGVNVLRNDAVAALAVAAAAGAQFIRVNVHTGTYATDQGIIEGRAAETLASRQRLGADVAILADVHVKHAQPLDQPDIALAAEETAYRGKADGVIVSGSTTARPADHDDVTRVKKAVPDRPVLVGSGVTPDNVKAYLDLADGVIVGSCLREDGRAGAPLVPDRVQRFAASAAS